jgi:hypothetical protein
MNKILVGILCGLVLGAIDGATAWFTPDARPMMTSIMGAHRLKAWSSAFWLAGLRAKYNR